MTQASGYRQGDYIEAIERLFHDGSVAGLSEAQLLERFAARRDGAAFAALVERHGPMVLGVCRRFLRDPNDVDDAFQAVFLVLIRKASGLRRKELLGNWLYGVACRVAVRARSLAAKREARAASSGDAERLAVDHRRPAAEEPWEAVMRDEGRTWLHEEVERLPRRFRAPVVACYFEGRTHEEAATLLGCPLGTVKGRLALARDMLRKRLERRGLAVPAVALASQLASPDLRAAVPAPLTQATVRSGLALASAASLMTTPAITTSVRTLTEGVLHAMVVSHLKAVAIPSFLVAAGLLAAGARVAARQDGDGKPQPEQAAVAPGPQVEVPRDKADQSGSQPEAETVSDADFLERIRAYSGSYLSICSQALADRDVEGLSAAGRQTALKLQINRLEALIRSAARIEPVSQAGRALNGVFLEFLESERVDYSKLQPNQGRGPSQFKGFGTMDDVFGEMLARLKEELRSIASAEEKELVVDLRKEGLYSSIANMGLQHPLIVKLYHAYMDFRWSMDATPDLLSNNDDGKALALANEVRPTGADAESAGSNAKPEPPKSPALAAPAKPAQAANASGGGGGFGGGGMSGPTPEETRQKIAELSALLSKYDENPSNRVVLEALNQPITLQTNDKTTLGDLLKQIKQSVTISEGKKIPVYVDPKGVEEADASLASPVSIDLEDVPLKFSLRLALKQLGLAYCVRDGVLIISSIEGVEQELKEAESELMGLHPEKVIYSSNGRVRRFGIGGMVDGMGGMGGGMR